MFIVLFLLFGCAVNIQATSSSPKDALHEDHVNTDSSRGSVAAQQETFCCDGPDSRCADIFSEEICSRFRMCEWDCGDSTEDTPSGPTEPDSNCYCEGRRIQLNRKCSEFDEEHCSAVPELCSWACSDCFCRAFEEEFDDKCSKIRMDESCNDRDECYWECPEEECEPSELDGIYTSFGQITMGDDCADISTSECLFRGGDGIFYDVQVHDGALTSFLQFVNEDGTFDETVFSQRWILDEECDCFEGCYNITTLEEMEVVNDCDDTPISYQWSCVDCSIENLDGFDSNWGVWHIDGDCAGRDTTQCYIGDTDRIIYDLVMEDGIFVAGYYGDRNDDDFFGGFSLQMNPDCWCFTGCWNDFEDPPDTCDDESQLFTCSLCEEFPGYRLFINEGELGGECSDYAMSQEECRDSCADDPTCVAFDWSGFVCCIWGVKPQEIIPQSSVCTWVEQQVCQVSDLDGVKTQYGTLEMLGDCDDPDTSTCNYGEGTVMFGISVEYNIMTGFCGFTFDNGTFDTDHVDGFRFVLNVDCDCFEGCYMDTTMEELEPPEDCRELEFLYRWDCTDCSIEDLDGIDSQWGTFHIIGNCVGRNTTECYNGDDPDNIIYDFEVTDQNIITGWYGDRNNPEFFGGFRLEMNEDCYCWDVGCSTVLEGPPDTCEGFEESQMVECNQCPLFEGYKLFEDFSEVGGECADVEKTIDECAEMCVNDPNCEAFDWFGYTCCIWDTAPTDLEDSGSGCTYIDEDVIG